MIVMNGLLACDDGRLALCSQRNGLLQSLHHSELLSLPPLDRTTEMASYILLLQKTRLPLKSNIRLYLFDILNLAKYLHILT
jgi:hypothetical protein